MFRDHTEYPQGKIKFSHQHKYNRCNKYIIFLLVRERYRLKKAREFYIKRIVRNFLSHPHSPSPNKKKNLFP